MNNLTQNGHEQSSVQPGVSGESRNAPYGPKAATTESFEEMRDWGNHLNKMSVDKALKEAR